MTVAPARRRRASLAAPDDGNEVFDHYDDEDLAGHHILDEAEVRELRRAHLAKTAANALQQSELTEEILRLLPRNLSHLQRMLKVRAGASITVVDQSMRTRLAKEPESVVAMALHDALRAGIGVTTSTCTLTEPELAALLGGRPSELRFL